METWASIQRTRSSFINITLLSIASATDRRCQSTAHFHMKFITMICGRRRSSIFHELLASDRRQKSTSRVKPERAIKVNSIFIYGLMCERECEHDSIIAHMRLHAAWQQRATADSVNIAREAENGETQNNNNNRSAIVIDLSIRER